MEYIEVDKAIEALYRYIFPTKKTIEEDIRAIPTIDIVKCVDCRKCKEQGGHANCNGYLYCTKQKTMVDEDCFCSWGERKSE